MVKQALLYVHGKGGDAQEARRYDQICSEFDVIGVDYCVDFPWIVTEPIRNAFVQARRKYDHVYLLANSIGAYFSMLALKDCDLKKALFISPILDMEKLISDMMMWAGVTEKELQSHGEIPTNFGETLSWEYLCYAREHPIDWKIPTEILYAGHDHLTDRQTVDDFAKHHDARLMVFDQGEHWFHTEEQLTFLDQWLRRAL